MNLRDELWLRLQRAPRWEDEPKPNNDIAVLTEEFHRRLYSRRSKMMDMQAIKAITARAKELQAEQHKDREAQERKAAAIQCRLDAERIIVSIPALIRNAAEKGLDSVIILNLNPFRGKLCGSAGNDDAPAGTVERLVVEWCRKEGIGLRTEWGKGGSNTQFLMATWA